MAAMLVRRQQVGWVTRVAWRVIVSILAIVLGLSIAVVTLLHAPPAESLRRLVLPLLRRSLGDKGIRVGELHLSIGRKGFVRFSGLVVPAPEGFSRPLLEIEQFVLRYDASLLWQGKATVTEILVSRPRLSLEQDAGGRLNWSAFADDAGEGDAEPIDDAEMTRPETEDHFPFRIDLDKLRIVDLSAVALMKHQQISLDHLDLDASGHYAGLSDLKVQVGIHVTSRHGGLATAEPNVTLALEQPVPISGAFEVAMEIDAHSDRFDPLNARGDVRLRVQSHRMRSATGDVKPIHLGLDVRTHVNLARRRVGLDRFKLKLNKELLADITGTVRLPNGDGKTSAATNVQSDSSASSAGLLRVHVTRLRAPLEMLEPYAHVFVDGFRSRGAIGLQNVRFASLLDGSTGALRPVAFDGSMRFEDVSVNIAKKHERGSGRPSLASLSGQSVGIERVSGRVVVRSEPHAATRPHHVSGSAMFEQMKPLSQQLSDRNNAEQSERTSDSVASAGRSRLSRSTIVSHSDLSVRRLRGFGVDVRSLRLLARSRSLWSSLDSAVAALRARLELGSTAYTAYGRRPLTKRTHLSVAGYVDRRDKTLDVKTLQLAVDDLIRLHGRATASAGRAFDARVSLGPVNLKRVIARIPRRLWPRGSAGVSGVLKASAQVRGPSTVDSNVPWHRLPHAVDANVELTGVGLRLPKELVGEAARVRDLNADVQLRGTFSDLKLEHRLKIAQFSGYGVEARRVNAPGSVRLDLRSRSRTDIKASAQIGVARLQTQSGIRARRTSVKLDAQSTLSDWDKWVRTGHARLRGARLSVAARTAGAKVRTPGIDLAVQNARSTIVIEHDDKQKRPLRWDVSLRASRIAERLQGASGTGLRLSLAGTAGGYRLTLPATVVVLPDLVATQRLGFALQTFQQPIVLDRTLSRIAGEFDLDLAKNGPLAVRKLRFSVPDFGFSVKGKARLDHPHEIDLKRRLPIASLALHIGLKNPNASKKEQATGIYKTLKTSGACGVAINLRTESDSIVSADAQLLADRFYLWFDHSASMLDEPDFDGLPRGRHRLLRVANLNAHVPFHQRISVDLRRNVAAPIRRSSEAPTLGGPHYDVVRPYLARQGNFQLDGVTLLDRLVAYGEKKEVVLSEKSLRIGRTALDLSVRDAGVELDRLHVGLLGGDLFGNVHLELLSERPLNFRLRTNIRMTDIDFARLNSATSTRSDIAPVSALARLELEWARRSVSSKLVFTDLSLKTLDSLLEFVDPHGQDESVQANRRLLGAWYTKLVDPEVQRVQAWVQHSLLNLDIELDAIWPINALLRRALRGLRIRRLPIKPLLPKTTESTADALRVSPSARHRPGNWRVR